MMKYPNLSKSQQEVIKLMDAGWELGRYTDHWGQAPSSYVFHLQKGGLGKGDKYRRIQKNTILKLITLGLVKSIGGIEPERYIRVVE